MIASPAHWRRLILTIALLMLAAFLAPKLIGPPQIQENRSLAVKPARPTSLDGVRAYPKAMDAYVMDHFPIRPYLIGALNRLRMLVGVSGSPKVIVGRDGWLFYDAGDDLGSARNVPPWTQAQARDWLLGLAGRTEFLRARGIAYVVVSPPMKETVYPQFGPPGYDGPSLDRRAVRLSQLAVQTQAGEVAYLHAPIAEAFRRGLLTYSRHDTHWTGYGAYAGYAALMGRLHALGLTEGPRPFSDFVIETHDMIDTPRDLALMLGVSSFVDIAYPSLRSKTPQPVQTTWLTPGRLTPKIDPGRLPLWKQIRRAYRKWKGTARPFTPRAPGQRIKYDWAQPHVIDTGQAGKPVLLITVDSFSNELLPFMYRHFSRIVVAHNQDGAWREDLIARYRPNIVMLEVLEAGLGSSLQPAPQPSAEAVSRIDQALPEAASHSIPAAFGTPPPIVRLSAPTPARLGQMAGAARADHCNIEAAALTQGPGGASLALSGWITDLAAGGEPSDGLVALQGASTTLAAELRIDGERADVADHFEVPAAASSGFEQTFRIIGLPPGDYAVTVFRPSARGWLACRGPQALRAP